MVGIHFGIKTIYASLMVSLSIWFLELIWPITQPITNDLLLELLMGILISGTGMGIVFIQGASTGGTDITAKIVHKLWGIDLGKAVFMFDAIIVMLAGVTYGFKMGLYAFLGVLLNGLIIDYVIAGINLKKEITIISEAYEAIKEFIITDLDRGFTVYYGKGGYSETEFQIIHVILNHSEFVKLRLFIKEHDQKAFVTAKATKEVYGNGFKEI